MTGPTKPQFADRLAVVVFGNWSGQFRLADLGGQIWWLITVAHNTRRFTLRTLLVAMLPESHRIPLETAHQFLAMFGITQPTPQYERWVKEDGFDFADFPDVLGESPFILGVDWRAALSDELPLIADALAKLDVELTIDIDRDGDGGYVDSAGGKAGIKYRPSGDDDFTDVIAAIQSVVPANIELRGSPNNTGTDAWQFAVLPRDE